MCFLLAFAYYGALLNTKLAFTESQPTYKKCQDYKPPGPMALMSHSKIAPSLHSARAMVSVGKQMEQHKMGEMNVLERVSK